MTRITPLYTKRRWLNKLGNHTTAFVYANVEREDTGQNLYMNGSVTIADCTRQISLALGADANTLKKLDTLLTVLGEVRDVIAAECEFKRTEWVPGAREEE